MLNNKIITHLFLISLLSLTVLPVEAMNLTKEQALELANLEEQKSLYEQLLPLVREMEELKALDKAAREVASSVSSSGSIDGLTGLNAQLSAGSSGVQDSTPIDYTYGSYKAKASWYYPCNDKMEGGTKDRKGRKLYTVQDYLQRGAPYAAVAMDTRAFAYWQPIRIPELEQDFGGKKILFRVVDTGGAFRGKGKTRIDIHGDAIYGCSEKQKLRNDVYYDKYHNQKTVTIVPSSGRNSSGGSSTNI